MSDFLSNVWENVKDAHEVTNDPRRWDELLEAPQRHYKRSTSTTLGKVAMTALTAWGAGALMGAMGGGGSAAGASTSGGTATGAGAGGTAASEGLIAGAGGSGGAGTVATANTATGSISGGSVMPNVAGEAISTGVAQGGVSSAGGAVGGGAVASNTAGSGGASTGGAGGGVSGGTGGGAGSGVSGGAGGNAGGGFWDAVKSGGEYVGSFAKENPEVSAAMLQGVSSAASPDEIDMMHEQEKIRQERLERQNRNIAGVGDIDMGLGEGGGPLRDQFGNRVYGPGSGIIQRNIGMNSPARDQRGARVDEEGESRLWTNPTNRRSQ